MRKLLFSLIILSIFFTGETFAAEVSTPAPIKIGVVDVQTIATESEAAKAAREQLESKYGKERSNLEKQGKDLQKQAEGLKNPKTTDNKKMAFIKAKQKLDNESRNFLRKVEQDEVKLRQEMVTLIYNATYKVARAQGYNFVVDVNGGGVLYADQSMNLTPAVLEEVNKLYNESKTKAEPEKTESAAPEDKK